MTRRIASLHGIPLSVAAPDEQPINQTSSRHCLISRNEGCVDQDGGGDGGVTEKGAVIDRDWLDMTRGKAAASLADSPYYYSTSEEPVQANVLERMSAV